MLKKLWLEQWMVRRVRDPYVLLFRRSFMVGTELNKVLSQSSGQRSRPRHAIVTQKRRGRTADISVDGGRPSPGLEDETLPGQL